MRENPGKNMSTIPGYLHWRKEQYQALVLDLSRPREGRLRPGPTATKLWTLPMRIAQVLLLWAWLDTSDILGHGQVQKVTQQWVDEGRGPQTFTHFVYVPAEELPTNLQCFKMDIEVTAFAIVAKKEKNWWFFAQQMDLAANDAGFFDTPEKMPTDMERKEAALYCGHRIAKRIGGGY